MPSRDILEPLGQYDHPWGKNSFWWLRLSLMKLVYLKLA